LTAGEGKIFKTKRFNDDKSTSLIWLNETNYRIGVDFALYGTVFLRSISNTAKIRILAVNFEIEKP
jgi:hypothetical protein